MLRRVLQHRFVKRAVMVEIDGEVIRLAREFLPGIGGDAWTDARAEVIVGDGIDYVQRAPDGAFDVVWTYELADDETVRRALCGGGGDR